MYRCVHVHVLLTSVWYPGGRCTGSPQAVEILGSIPRILALMSLSFITCETLLSNNLIEGRMA